MSNPDFLTRLDGIYGGCFVCDEDGHTHGLALSIRDALLELGFIWREADGTWRIKKEHLDYLDRRPDIWCCDFCAGRPVVWDVECATFDLDGQISQGGWAACETCGALVAENKRKALFDRCLATVTFASHEFLIPWHRLFWQHYRGIRRVPRPLYFGH